MEEQSQAQSGNSLSDPHAQVPEASPSNPPLTGIWRYAQAFGVKPSLLLLARRYVHFGIVGASGIVVDMTALFILADPRMLHLNLSLSKALAAEIAIISNFMGNEFWTFRDRAMTDPTWIGRMFRFGKFNLICMAGIALSVLLLNIQTRFFDVNMYVGNLIAIFIVSLWNFGMNQRFGWKKAGA
jgi:putative flippase GtrA